jgi:hypothetical protein
MSPVFFHVAARHKVNLICMKVRDKDSWLDLVYDDCVS